MEKTIIVNELLKECMRQVAKGNGEKRVFISTDDEGNGFHNLFYGLTDSQEDIDAYYKMGCINEKDNVILLG